MPDTKLLIIVPLYQQPDLIPALLKSLIDVAGEIAALNGKILLINDSPGHTGLATALDRHIPQLAASADIELLVNDINLGFVGACNRGFALALDSRSDVLLLNSDTLVTAGAITELAAVAAIDPLTAVVSPRSNNATICNSPYPDRYRGAAFVDAWQAHLAIQERLPRVSYVPTAVGFCLYIRYLMLEEFGIFDTIYGGGYNEENDLIMRCSRRGYRAVLANHAFVYHIGNASFEQSAVAPSERERVNRAVLLNRYPEYDRSVRRYFDSAEYRAQYLLAGLVPNSMGKQRILFDCRNVGTYFNGTFEHNRQLMAAFVEKYSESFECFVNCSAEAYAFHAFDQISGLIFCDRLEPEMVPFAAAFRISQPFLLQNIIDIAELAPVTGFLMLDTIAMDCQQLDDNGLQSIWRNMLQMVAIVGFNSDFTAEQFRRRFTIPQDVVQFVSLCSTDTSDYIGAGRIDDGAPNLGGHILLVGNHYPHKHVLETLELLRQTPARPPIVVLGVEVDEEPGIQSYRAGELDQAFVDSLYDNASVVLFPSHYEGFGLPVLHALARRKPLVGRDMAILREVRDHTPFAANIRLYETTRQMVEAALGSPAWVDIDGEGLAALPHNWEQAADALANALNKAITEVRFDQLVQRQLFWENANATIRLADQHAYQAAIANIPQPAAPQRTKRPMVLGLSTMYRPVRRIAIRHLRQCKRLWQSLHRGGKVLRTSLSVSPDDYRGGVYAHISASINAGEFPSGELVLALLKWAEFLQIDGTLKLRSSFRPEPDGDFDPFTTAGLRVRLAAAGFEIQDIDMRRGTLVAHAQKKRDWTEALSSAADDQTFLEEVYEHALGRSLDPSGAKHYCEQLEQGYARLDVLRDILSSAEYGRRIEYLAGKH